jgi:hypothetical protein
MIFDMRQSANPRDGNSLSNRLRSARFRKFEELVAPLPRPLRILDVGGRTAFWENRGWAGHPEFQILSLNLIAEEQRYENITPAVGDATNLSQFDDGSFDIAFSNSLIEHLFTFENQLRMASEMRRIGRAFWVQTPNYWFPMEPHFHVPGWQWMPVDLRISIIRRRRCGWLGPIPDPSRARLQIEEMRLLTKSELITMFPGATLIPERFCGLVKSWIMIGGFPGNR